MSVLIQPKTVDLLDAFRSQVSLHPSLAAVVHDDKTMSYEEVSALSHRIAGAIRQATGMPSPRVLLAVPTSAEAYAGMIGTLIAGGTFCPVNVSGPEARNTVITKSFAPDVILFVGTPASFLDDSPATTPRIDISRLGNHHLDSAVDEHSDIAYVVFTSGSTGQAKGVKIGRAGFSYFLDVAHTIFNLSPGERWGQFSNLGYDLAVMDVFLAVTGGATLVPLVSRKERLMPAEAIKEKRIAVWQSVPSVIELMIQAKQVSSEFLAPLRLMSFCGEPLLPRQLDALFKARPELEVLNTFGATETTGFNTVNRLTENNYKSSCEGPTVALGEDVAGWNLALRGGDSNDEGEIVVSSNHLSLGYWSDEDLTRGAFRQLTSGPAQERRAYFTGDWGERKNSRLYFACRKDRQIKIRGERIELDEIDFLLRETGFPTAYTIQKGDDLHSFVESSDSVDAELIRTHLAKRLPFHSVPKTVKALPALPRNPNGKIDRNALEQQLTL